MKIAYIIDGSTELSPSINKEQNIYSRPFKGYDESGVLVNIRNKSQLESIQKIETKQYIEPTPGIYRDLYRDLKNEGYDYIVCIPQSRNSSSSYTNAEYASRFYSDFVVVLDALEYKLSTEEVLYNLINDKEIKDDSNILQFTFEQLFDVIKGILVQVKLVKA